MLVHCLEAGSRRQWAAALYAARELGVPLEQALIDIQRSLLSAAPADFLTAAVRRLATEPR